MGIEFDIIYNDYVLDIDIPKLSTSDKKRIKESIENKLTTEPEIFGKPLRRSLGGYRKLRVGDHRVIFQIQNQKVKILCIGHRSVVYKKFDKRI